MVDYFQGDTYDEKYNEASKYTPSCHSKIDVICPVCNSVKKDVNICSLHQHGYFYCKMCSDSISQPEKMLLEVLKWLNVDFTFQITRKNEIWINNFRYDFQLYVNGIKYIVETHGEQHYSDNTGFKTTLEEVQSNDMVKKQLAYMNGYNDNTYIVIDCRSSKIDWLKDNIIKSLGIILPNLYNISDDKWYDFEKVKTSSQKYLARKLYNEMSANNSLVNALECYNEGVRMGYIFVSYKTFNDYLKDNINNATKNKEIVMNKCKQMHSEGISKSKISKILDIHRSTVYKYLNT